MSCFIDLAKWWILNYEWKHRYGTWGLLLRESWMSIRRISWIFMREGIKMPRGSTCIEGAYSFDVSNCSKTKACVSWVVIQYTNETLLIWNKVMYNVSFPLLSLSLSLALFIFFLSKWGRFEARFWMGKSIKWWIKRIIYLTTKRSLSNNKKAKHISVRNWAATRIRNSFDYGCF